MSLFSTFPDTASITERVNVQNSSGERAGTQTSVATSVPCRVWAMNAREREMQGLKDGERGTHRMLCASDAGLTRTCRVTVSSVVYDVVELDDARFGMLAHHTEAVLRRLAPE